MNLHGISGLLRGIVTLSFILPLFLAQANEPLLPVVNLDALDPIATESGKPAEVVVRRSGAADAPLLVRYSIAGTASSGVDYAALSGELSIPAGQANARITVAPVNDALVEDDETVVLTLQPHDSYSVGLHRTAVVIVRDNPDPENVRPMIWIAEPEEGTIFGAETNITFLARGYDSDGDIVSVEFFNGTESLGVAPYRQTGTSVSSFHFTWIHAPAGYHMVTAVATDNRGAVSHSRPVGIRVLGPADPAVVMVFAYHIYGAEPGPDRPAKKSGIVFRRSHGLFVTLPVYYSVSGTARNGIDYTELSGTVVFSPGEQYAIVELEALADLEIEETETVVVTLEEPNCIAIFPPPPECYLVSRPNRTIVYIEDAPQGGNYPPTVELAAPLDGNGFRAPAKINFFAQAADLEGQVTQVEFFSGHDSLGVVSAPPYRLIWDNVPAGFYTLRAKATDNGGKSAYSAPARIAVRSAEQQEFVKRQLPLIYVPGVPLTVRLQAQSPDGVTSYTIDERPPQGWTASVTGDHGVWNPAEGRITFGPFEDKSLKVLTYQARPPADAQGVAQFHGVSVAHGQAIPIGGQSHISSALRHPADREPGYFAISAGELAAYIAAWRKGESWPESPNPIPINFVTRAGFIFVRGEAYTISTESPTPFPPMLWEPSSDGGTPFQGPLPPTPIAPSPWTTNHNSEASRTLPSHYQSGTAFQVSIQVTPPEGIQAYAVAERPPHGWTVTDISSSGVFCELTQTVKWGPFLGAGTRTLTYSISPGAKLVQRAAFSGVASFNGVGQLIAGNDSVLNENAPNEQPENRTDVKALESGEHLLSFPSETGKMFRIEASDNLIDWIPLDALLNTDGTLHYIDPQSGQRIMRFYRQVPEN